MVARANRKSVDKAQAEKYRRVGAALLESATVLSELATDADSFGNAIAVVAVHACIAHDDALSIAWKGVKSTEGDHGGRRTRWCSPWDTWRLRSRCAAWGSCCRTRTRCRTRAATSA